MNDIDQTQNVAQIGSSQATKPLKQAKKPIKKVDASRALTLKLENKLSYKQIGQLQGVSAQAIHQAIKDLLPTDETELYKNNRADILANLQAKILKSIEDDDIKKSPFGSRVLAFCQLTDKERLERGQSTDNIHMIHQAISQLRQVKPLDVTPDISEEDSFTNRIVANADNK